MLHPSKSTTTFDSLERPYFSSRLCVNAFLRFMFITHNIWAPQQYGDQDRVALLLKSLVRRKKPPQVIGGASPSRPHFEAPSPPSLAMSLSWHSTGCRASNNQQSTQIGLPNLFKHFAHLAFLLQRLNPTHTHIHTLHQTCLGKVSALHVDKFPKKHER